MEFSTDWMQRYLSHKLGPGGAIQIRDITRFPRGSSRETWFVEYSRADVPDDVQKIVFRTDLPVGGSITPSPLDHEYAIYDKLGRSAVPVAPVLWWEDDPAWLTPGRSFYVRRQIAGHWDIPHYFDPDPGYDELRIDISKEHLRKLALVHTADWRALGLDQVLDAPADTASCGQTYVATVLRRIEGMRGEAMPVVLEAAEWLCDTAPPAPRISLCKGTNGYGEEIFQGREIIALSDWEEASIGDPAADFAFVQDFIPEIQRDGRRIWGLAQALDYYRSVSGIEILESSVVYYRSVRALCAVSMGYASALPFLHGELPYPRQAWMAAEAAHIYEHCLAALVGLLPSLPPSRMRELADAL